MTPRRILLLMGGLFACGVVYALYARALGWLDGLPLLPEPMLKPTDGRFRPPERATSPTIERLKLSFGITAPETETSFYPTQLEFRNGDTSIVLASGSPPSNPNSNTVTLTPFSIAIFSKPRPAHLLQPGEVNEITTFHSDKAVLEFDRVIQTPADMNSAKLIRMQLISDPEASVPASDKRAGIVHITNNQRSADPNRALVLKTVGPVFYRDPKFATGPDQLGPDVWTDSAIEIADRSNLPRKTGADAVVAAALAEEVRHAEAVAAMLKGDRLPPPTVTAVGMRIYLDSDDPKKHPAVQAKAPPARKGTAGFSGVRRVELLEQVLLNLWVEGGQGTLVGSSSRMGAGVEPPPGAAAVSSGLVWAAHAVRELGRDLLQVETRGPFSYDADRNLARFDVLPQANPNLRNDVRVTKVPPRPGVQSLFSQVLEIEFNGAPTGNQPARPTPGTAPTSGGGPRFKRLHAWTYTPGRFLTVSSDADQMDAHGQDLVHEQATQKTTLTGSPLHAVQQRNILTAGSPKKPAVLIIEPSPVAAAPPGGTRAGASNQATVLGPGKVELFDAAARANTTTATWQTSMVHTKERIDDSELDLFTLNDGARFEDVHADYWLVGKVLKLWLLPAARESAANQPGPPAASRARPHRIQAIGEVSGHSAELDIEKCDQLIAYFADAVPVAAVNGPVAPRSPAPPPAQPAPGPAPKAVAEKEPAKPAKPPMKVRARTIDTWVTRSPAPGAASPPAPAGNEPASPALKYQLEKARCEGMVSVHQDPQDVTKPRGTDILGSRMLIDSTPDGSVLTVFGWDDRPGEVHNEGTSLIGPKIVIDQLHNLAVIEGRGSLAIPSSGDLTGAETKTGEPVVIHFRDGMTFMGARQTAEFFGKVSASQAGSQVACHTMRVLFDRPVYFTQSNRPLLPAGSGTPKEEKARIDVVYCYPAPGDTADNSLEKIVTYSQVDREPQSGKPIRLQRIEAQEITLRAQFRDSDRSEPYRLVTAHGPGTVRTWAPGSRDDDPTGPIALGGPPAKQPNGKPSEIEMKLTVVRFAIRMTAKDKGNLYKEATFTDQIKVVHVPTDNPELDVSVQLPSRAVLLTCDEKLVVWTRKVENGPPQQSMHAHGNAYLQNDEYEGWGEVIQSEGKMVRFFGTKDLLARIKSRFGGTDQPGETITHDRATGHSKVDGSIGGTLTTRPAGGPPPKKQNRPVPPR